MTNASAISSTKMVVPLHTKSILWIAHAACSNIVRGQDVPPCRMSPGHLALGHNAPPPGHSFLVQTVPLSAECPSFWAERLREQWKEQQVGLKCPKAVWKTIYDRSKSMASWYKNPEASPSLVASSTGPILKNWERGLVSLAKIPICAESAYYATHRNNHIPYVIDSLHSSRASALRNVIIGNGRT